MKKKEEKYIKTIKQGMIIGWFLPFVGPAVTLVFSALALVGGSKKRTLIIWGIVLSVLYFLFHLFIVSISPCCN